MAHNIGIFRIVILSCWLQEIKKALRVIKTRRVDACHWRWHDAEQPDRHPSESSQNPTALQQSEHGQSGRLSAYLMKPRPCPSLFQKQQCGWRKAAAQKCCDSPGIAESARCLKVYDNHDPLLTVPTPDALSTTPMRFLERAREPQPMSSWSITGLDSALRLKVRTKAKGCRASRGA